MNLISFCTGSTTKSANKAQVDLPSMNTNISRDQHMAAQSSISVFATIDDSANSQAVELPSLYTKATQKQLDNRAGASLSRASSTTSLSTSQYKRTSKRTREQQPQLSRGLSSAYDMSPSYSTLDLIMPPPSPLSHASVSPRTPIFAQHHHPEQQQHRSNSGTMSRTNSFDTHMFPFHSDRAPLPGNVTPRMTHTTLAAAQASLLTGRVSQPTTPRSHTQTLKPSTAQSLVHAQAKLQRSVSRDPQSPGDGDGPFGRRLGASPFMAARDLKESPSYFSQTPTVSPGSSPMMPYSTLGTPRGHSRQLGRSFGSVSTLAARSSGGSDTDPAPVCQSAAPFAQIQSSPDMANHYLYQSEAYVQPALSPVPGSHSGSRVSYRGRQLESESPGINRSRSVSRTSCSSISGFSRGGTMQQEFGRLSMTGHSKNVYHKDFTSYDAFKRDQDNSGMLASMAAVPVTPASSPLSVYE